MSGTLNSVCGLFVGQIIVLFFPPAHGHCSFIVKAPQKNPNNPKPKNKLFRPKSTLDCLLRLGLKWSAGLP